MQRWSKRAKRAQRGHRGAVCTRRGPINKDMRIASRSLHSRYSHAAQCRCMDTHADNCMQGGWKPGALQGCWPQTDWG